MIPWLEWTRFVVVTQLNPNIHQRQPDCHPTPPKPPPTSTRPPHDPHPHPPTLARRQDVHPHPIPVAPDMHHSWTCRHTIGGWHVCTDKRWPSWYVHPGGWMVNTLKHPIQMHITLKAPSECHPKRHPTKPKPPPMSTRPLPN